MNGKKSLFISYQAGYKKWVAELRQALEQLGFEVRSDSSLRLGDDAYKWINTATVGIDGFVYLHGERIGPWQQDELDAVTNRVRDGTVRLLYVLLPKADSKTIRPLYEKYTRLDLRDAWDPERVAREVQAAFDVAPPEAPPAALPHEALTIDVSQSVEKLILRVRGSDCVFEVDPSALTEFLYEVQLGLEGLSMEWSVRSSSSASRDTVLRLALNGRGIRRFIFEDNEDEDAARLVAHLERYPSLPITFDVAKLDVHVPWGLLFGACGSSDEVLEDLSDDELRARFWWDAHRVMVEYRVTDGPPERRQPASSSARLIAALHDEAWSYVDPNHTADWPDACHGGYDWMRAQAATENHVVLYFFCDCKDEHLRLHDDDSDHANIMTPMKFKVRTRPRASGIVFFNTPVDVHSGGNNAWRMVTHEKGLCGFISPQVAVPTRFAWRFGNTFLHYIFRERLPVLDAMSRLRRDYWPFSLLYGSYCARDFAVHGFDASNFVPTPTPAEAANDAAASDDRYATLPFRTHTTGIKGTTDGR